MMACAQDLGVEELKDACEVFYYHDYSSKSYIIHNYFVTGVCYFYFVGP